VEGKLSLRASDFTFPDSQPGLSFDEIEDHFGELTGLPRKLRMGYELQEMITRWLASHCCITDKLFFAASIARSVSSKGSSFDCFVFSMYSYTAILTWF